MYCMKCGKQLPDDALFCLYCGSKVDVEFIRAHMYGSAQTNAAPVNKQEKVVKAEPKTAAPIIQETLVGTKQSQYIYQEILSAQELQRIEEWGRTGDPRTEQQLKNDIAMYLSNAELLKDYMIDREVSPSRFNANKIMQNHGKCWENGRHYTNGDVFDVNHYGKQASFVIRDKAGKPKMMIMVGKPMSYTHWLVQWCVFWCRDNQIPLLKFNIGFSNTEHYVVRRTYEEMGLVKKVLV